MDFVIDLTGGECVIRAWGAHEDGFAPKPSMKHILKARVFYWMLT